MSIQIFDVLSKQNRSDITFSQKSIIVTKQSDLAQRPEGFFYLGLFHIFVPRTTEFDAVEKNDAKE